MGRALAAVCASALAVSGCGALDQDQRGGAGDRDSAPLSLTKPQARELAKSMLIRRSDLPRWGERRIRSRKLPRVCGRPGRADSFRMLGANESPLFTKLPEVAFVASWAGILASEEDARAGFEETVRALGGRRGQACLLGSMRRGGGDSGASFERLGRRPIRYEVAERSWGFRWTFRVRTGTRSARGYMSLLFMQDRQALGFVLSGRVGKPFERKLEQRLSRLVAKRMHAAQAAQAS